MFEEYINSIDDKWKDAFMRLMNVVDDNIPEGFEKTMQYNMISYVVPLATYPSGYHVTPNTPLPFISLGVQKRHIALYHMGIYGNAKLLQWFQDEYSKRVPTKLNMGKSCIRFTSTKNIPYDLIGELVARMSMGKWIECYEVNKK
ncbi:MAG TPA: DUF1801 domain-containing protein [Rummeliibacillus sp.]|nr:DUF1801 domain-containing protein [Rummeliibacillus sp.]